jgi:hypothetical protein
MSLRRTLFYKFNFKKPLMHNLSWNLFESFSTADFHFMLLVPMIQYSFHPDTLFSCLLTQRCSSGRLPRNLLIVSLEQSDAVPVRILHAPCIRLASRITLIVQAISESTTGLGTKSTLTTSPTRGGYSRTRDKKYKL